MKTTDALTYFGSQHAIAKALGIKQPSVANWGEFPPELRQLQIQALTKRALKAEKSILPKSCAAAMKAKK